MLHYFRVQGLTLSPKSSSDCLFVVCLNQADFSIIEEAVKARSSTCPFQGEGRKILFYFVLPGDMRRRACVELHNMMAFCSHCFPKHSL